MRQGKTGGGWRAIWYTVTKSLEVGPWQLWQKMRARNACKTCALGMGGQLGGMVNEKGHFPEVCKKSLQAQVADMKGAIAVDFFETHDIDALRRLTPKQSEDAGRLIYPVVYNPNSRKFQPIAWESAMQMVAAAMKETTPDRTAFYASGRSSNEAAFLLQMFARVYGTNNVMNCSYYCHQASGVGLKLSFGTGTATITLDDIAKSDLVVLLGANPASNHPRLMTQLADLRARGGKVIVVNPLRERPLEKFHVPSRVGSLLFGTEIASLYIQPYAGGDVAVLVGVLKSIIEKDQVDKQFVKQFSVGWEAVRDDVIALSWEEIERNSGVSRAELVQMGDTIASSKGAIFAWAMGITHHASGVDNVLAIANLAIATGNIGKPGAGMMPIRGHSNVQGIGSIGFSPMLQEGVRLALEKKYKKQLPTTAGYDTHSMMDAAEQGKLDVLIALGGNLWGSNPNSDWAARAMQNIGTTIYLSTKLNPGHFYGLAKNTLILPVLARDEEPQATTQESMFNFVRLSEGGPPNIKGEMRAESDVICDLASRVLGAEPVDWGRMRSHVEVRKLIAEVIPGWEPIAEIDATKKEFTIEGRILHTSVFNLPQAKAAMHKTPLPKINPDELRLMTIRSEGQFNTVVYEEHDLYRGVPHRHCIILSPEDAERHSMRDGERIVVHGEAGSLNNIEVCIGRIRAGVAAMYYPEANVLIKSNLDPRSATPAFKSAPITIAKQ
jgi:molybdopterin-dependent oxidoreductase alpha subunit